MIGVIALAEGGAFKSKALALTSSSQDKEHSCPIQDIEKSMIAIFPLPETTLRGAKSPCFTPH